MPPQYGYPGPVQQPSYPSQPPKKSNNKLIILIVTVVIAIAAVALFFIVTRTDKPQSDRQSNTSESSDTSTSYKPASQGASAQLDVKYKNDATRLTAAITEYTANNSGSLPSFLELNNDFIDRYLQGTFNSPATGTPYTFVESDPQANEMQYRASAICTEDNLMASGSSRQLAVRTLLSNGDYFCISN